MADPAKTKARYGEWSYVGPPSRPSSAYSEMVAVAQQMGASHKLDLTSDTTHLIVGNIDTPKYKYVAKERQDIKVLSTSWLEAVRESWMTGGETDVAALEEEHRLPTFFGLNVCVTGFEDYAERNDLQETVTANGGTYRGDLTRTATHLIAATPRGKKYEYAQLWQIKTVGIEWLRDSLERGMALDEALYHPSLPAEERGIGAVTRKRMPSPPQVLGKRPRPDDAAHAPIDAGQRKLRRTASTRLESQSGNLWADIGGADRLPTPSSEPVEQLRGPDGAEDSLRHVAYGQPKAEDKPNAFGAGLNPGFLQPESYSGYYIGGFDDQKANVLAKHLQSNGASVYSSTDMADRGSKLPVIFLVPHNVSPAEHDEMLAKENFSVGQDELATECWLEKCLYSKRFVDPDAHPLYKPFFASAIPGFSDLIICPTSFGGIDLLHVSKAVKCTGATYDETLRKQTSVLVCNDVTSVKPEKLRYALENKIPVVSVQWLWECMRTKECLDFMDFAICGSRPTQNSAQPIFHHPEHNPRPRSAERKSKQSFRSSSGPAKSRSQRRGQLDLGLEIKPKPFESMVDEDPVERFNREETQDALPLQELSQSKTNSPQKRRSASPTKHWSDKDKEDDRYRPPPRSRSLKDDEVDSDLTVPGCAESQPQALASGEKSESLNSAIATLLAHQQKAVASRPSSASSDRKFNPEMSRRHRPLGRAPSNGSTALSRHNSLDVDRDWKPDGSTGLRESIVVEDDFDSVSTQARLAQESCKAFQPSQALSYEDPEGAALREKLMKRAGGDWGGGTDGTWDVGEAGNNMKRVEGIGRVTDGRSNAGKTDEKIRRRGARRK